LGGFFALLADVGVRCRPELRRQAQWHQGPAHGEDGFVWGARCKACLWYNSALERLVINFWSRVSFVKAGARVRAPRRGPSVGLACCTHSRSCRGPLGLMG
jgi:hypothetical protein